jgi:hypothetical protein
MLLNFLRVVMLVILALLMFGILQKNKTLKLPSLLVWLLLLPISIMPAQQAFADFPDPALLKELQTRLLQAPDCLPECAQIASMKLEIDSKQLEINLEIHAQQDVYLPLPAQVDQWLPSQVIVDGKTAQALYRSGNGKLWVGLLKGKHKLKMSGVAPLLNTFFIPLQLKPHWLEVTKSGWLVEGINEQGVVAKQLQFRQINKQTPDIAEKQKFQPRDFPAFFRVERTLKLGLKWRVSTRVVRITPANSAALLEVPLLAGEQVITPGTTKKNGKILINLPSGQTKAGWESELKKPGKLNYWLQIQINGQKSGVSI